jgi:hypothetical protein
MFILNILQLSIILACLPGTGSDGLPPAHHPMPTGGQEMRDPFFPQPAPGKQVPID